VAVRRNVSVFKRSLISEGKACRKSAARECIFGHRRDSGQSYRRRWQIARKLLACPRGKKPKLQSPYTLGSRQHHHLVHRALVRGSITTARQARQFNRVEIEAARGTRSKADRAATWARACRARGSRARPGTAPKAFKELRKEQGRKIRPGKASRWREQFTAPRRPISAAHRPGILCAATGRAEIGQRTRLLEANLRSWSASPALHHRGLAILENLIQEAPSA